MQLRQVLAGWGGAPVSIRQEARDGTLTADLLRRDVQITVEQLRVGYQQLVAGPVDQSLFAANLLDEIDRLRRWL